MMKTYTKFDKETGLVYARLTVDSDTQLDMNDIWVEGFYNSDFVYDFDLKMPVTKHLATNRASNNVARIEGRAFGDNVSFSQLAPYFAANIWWRIE